MKTVVILAGGLASRIYPISKDLPKSMIDIMGKPFIHWQLGLLAKSGIDEVVLCLGVKSEIIKNFVGDGSQFGISVHSSFDGEYPLGTGGAVIKALPILGDQFGVLYGDSYLPINYQEIFTHFESIDAPALMTVFQNNNNFDYSNVEFNSGNVTRYLKTEQTEKMKYIDYGLTIFSKKVFSRYPSSEFLDLAEIMHDLVEGNNLAGFEITQRFYEIGSFQGIDDFKNYLQGCGL
jgi:MurNAc alpha-1-phosphate uridylyltransferase